MVQFVDLTNKLATTNTSQSIPGPAKDDDIPLLLRSTFTRSKWPYFGPLNGVHSAESLS